MMSTVEELMKLINESEAIVIGAGAGLSTAAGFKYDGKRFHDNFHYMYEEYGYQDMYSAGFHLFDDEESKWGYWSKFVYINRYTTGALPLYKKLFKIFKDKNYFVITTNVDHQFQLSGFDKEKLYYTQGDYGLFQCNHCHKTFDNDQQIKEMINNIDVIKHKIPSVLIPKCPICGRKLDMNLRCDETFVEDSGWNKAANRYKKFIEENKNKKVLFLELGVGYNTPVIIKYPFMKMTYRNPKSHYVCINMDYTPIPSEIKHQSIEIKEDIDGVINLISIEDNYQE